MASQNNNPFISIEYLRVNSIINDNVDSKVLLPIIRMAETKYIQQVLGNNLYEKLVLLATSNPSLITGYYKTLLEEYIIPVLVQYSVYESVPFMNFKFRNKAISKQGSDNSTPADLSELSYIRDNVLQTAQFYSERMLNYIINNMAQFPEYTSANLDVAPDTQSYFNGIHIPKRGFRRRCFGDEGGEIRF